MISRNYFDVRLPLDNPNPGDSDPNFARGRYHFSQTCLWNILELSIAPSNLVTYSAVMKLDTKIRSWRLPTSLQGASFKPSEEENTVVNFREVTGLVFREITLLCLHRSVSPSPITLTLRQLPGHILRVRYWILHLTLSRALLRPVFSLPTEAHARSLEESRPCTPESQS